MSETLSSRGAEPEIIMQSDGTLDVRAIERQITPAWLTSALSERYPGVEVLTLKMTKLIAGFSVKVWIDVTYNQAGQRAGLPGILIVKAGFGRHQQINEFAYRAEMRAYRDVLPRFPINSPTCFYAGASPDGNSSAIIIEDLSPKQPRFCHAQTPLTFQEAASFLDALARFHAQSWDHPSLTDGSFGWANDQAAAKAGLAAYLGSLAPPDTWRFFIGQPRGAALPQVLHDRDRILAGFKRVQEKYGRGPQLVMMGDTHLGNLYIERDGTPGFIDFQSRTGPWSEEISYFLASGLDIVDRREWERVLVAHYLERLRAYGIKPPAFEDAWNEYCEQLVWVLFAWITNSALFQTESVTTAFATRLGAAVLENRTFERLGI